MTDYEQLEEILIELRHLRHLVETSVGQATDLCKMILFEESKTLDAANQILALLTPHIAGITITFSLGETMNNPSNPKPVSKLRGASLAIDIPDDGSKTVTAIVGFVDDVGNPALTAPGSVAATTVTLSNPAITATVDSTGLVITLAPTPVVPPAIPTLATGVSVSVTVTLTNPDGTVVGPFTVTGDTLISVVAGGPAGVVLQES